MFYSSASVKRMNDRKGKPWRGTLQYKDESGKWRQRTRVLHGARSKREAQVALEEWRQQMEAEHDAAQAAAAAEARGDRQANHGAQGTLGRDRPVTVARAVRDYLQRQHALGLLSLGTYQKQLDGAELNIFPRIGDIEFDKLTAQDVERFIASLAETMKPSTVRNLYSIVNKTYRDAEFHEAIDANPCAKVSLPRAERKQINYLDAEGRARFLDEVGKLPATSPMRIAALLAFFTGMRASEVCALRWRDVDFDGMVLHVSHSARRVRDAHGGHMVAIGPTKTPSGNRSIPLLQQAADMLLEVAEYRAADASVAAAQAANHRGPGRVSAPAPGDFVVGSNNDPALLCGSFQSWSRRRGIIGKAGKPISMHALRHTFATAGVQSGMDVKSLASILGHARADMTLNIYASDDEEAKRAAMRNLDRLLRTQGT